MIGPSVALPEVGPVKLDKAPLSLQIVRELRRAIEERRLEPGVRLPSEPDLARHLGVSRASLREALQVLERENLLTRRPGVGTYVTDRARLELHRGLDELFSTTELIESHGYRAGVRDVHVREFATTVEMAGLLVVGCGARLVHLSRTRLADDTPVIQCEEYLPRHLLEAAGIDLEELRGVTSLYAFLERRAGLRITTAEVNIRSSAATARLSARLGVARGHALLLLEQVHVAEDGQPICVSRNYHNSDLIRFRLTRRRVR